MPSQVGAWVHRFNELNGHFYDCQKHTVCVCKKERRSNTDTHSLHQFSLSISVQHTICSWQFKGHCEVIRGLALKAAHTLAEVQGNWPSSVLLGPSAVGSAVVLLRSRAPLHPAPRLRHCQTPLPPVHALFHPRRQNM
eukprot:4661691-Amphidinium_carterae.1